MKDLLRWIKHERQFNGLLCIHVFPGTEPVTDLNAWAQHLYSVLVSNDIIDITNDVL
jgi:hypothetical protein